MWGRGRIGGFALVGLLSWGCGDDGGGGDGGSTTLATASSSSSGGEVPNAVPTVVAEVDAMAACGQAGATRVELHATRVACIDPPPSPCTLPEPPRPVVGEGLDCPAAAPAQALRVELTQTGRYHVEVLTLAGEDELSRVCWVEGDDVQLLITEARLDDKPTIEVAERDGAPCG
jgi:hypothetical protein